jgi:cytoskeletal protein RodZ
MKWLSRKDDQQITPSIEQQRLNKLTELGNQLRLSRQAQGLSLDELVLLTRISRRLLQAIEEGNLDDLPEPIYIQGLIRQFADALGLNGAEFAGDFPIAPQPVTRPSIGKSTSIGGQLRPIHLYLLYIFLIVFSVNSLSHLLNNAVLQANNSQIQIPPQKSLTPGASIPPNDSPEMQPVGDNLVSNKEGQPVQIGVTLKSSSWIRVVADGKTEFEGILPEGTYRTWKAQQQLTVKTDNAGGVLMSVNQQEAKEMGEPGKVEEVRIAAKPKL